MPNQIQLSPSVSQSLGSVLPVSVGLTALSFIASTAVAEHSGHGIGEAANSITDNATPSVSHLSSMRTELRHLEVLISDEIDRVSMGPAGAPSSGQDALKKSRDLLFADWSAYRHLPACLGEADDWPAVDSDLLQLKESMARILALLDRGLVAGAQEMEQAALEPIFDRIDDQVTRLRDFNSSHHMEVEDTGPGLPPGIDHQIFEPFIRASQSTIPGMGLATVRHLVESHGGKLGVRSKQGEGCVFWFELPRASQEPRSAMDRSVFPKTSEVSKSPRWYAFEAF